tara:strand:+ start:424 stop:723 length:300 start_codon:yes stop_codon:yes gene_type:complete
MEFVDYAKVNKFRIVAGEIHESAIPLPSYNFNYSSRVALVVGQEGSGIPIEILKNSDTVFIPITIPGLCLNTSQTAKVLLYEAIKQYESQNKEKITEMQ